MMKFRFKEETLMKKKQGGSEAGLSLWNQFFQNIKIPIKNEGKIMIDFAALN